MRFAFSLIILLISTSVFGVELNTDQISVKFPSNWSCDLEQQSFLCIDASQGRQKSAVVLIHQKIAAPGEDMAQFRIRLKTPKSPKGKDGTPGLSRLISNEDRIINGHTWVESVHFEGELPEFYTYYLATRKGNHAFLITLSAHQTQWEKYRPVFESVIQSLQVFGNSTTDNLDAQRQAGAPQSGGFESTNLPLEERSYLEELAGGLSPAKIFLFVAILIAGAVALYFLR